MKPYAYISILFLFVLLAVAGCRSNRSLSENRQVQLSEMETEQSKETEVVRDSTSTHTTESTTEKETSHSQTEEAAEKEAQSDEYEVETTKTTYYGEDGKPKLIIETQRERGRTDKINERTGSSHASGGSRESHSELETKGESVTAIDRSGEQTKISGTELNAGEQIDRSEKSDSRIVQGWEWLAIIVPIAIIGAIALLFREWRKRNS